LSLSNPKIIETNAIPDSIQNQQQLWNAKPSLAQHQFSKLPKGSFGKKHACCKKRCCATLMRDDSFIDTVASWRCAWCQVPQQDQNNAIQQHIAECKPLSMPSTQSVEHCTQRGTVKGKEVLLVPTPRKGAAGRKEQFTFLNKRMCNTAFRKLTGVKISVFVGRAYKGAKAGDTKRGKNGAPVQDAMKAAIWMILEQLKHESPYADKDKLIVHVPFHHKVCLFRLIEQASKHIPNFPVQKPQYSTFKKVLSMPDFKCVQFHRIVDIGRCPKCKYLEFKVRSVGREFKRIWQKAFSMHHLQTMQCKRVYTRDRAIAAADYPHTELMIGIDCGSGQEFVLPHPSAADKDGPNHALDNLSTVPMKVCNAIVHGDQNSYIILSPGVVGATANHHIETFNMVINSVFNRLGMLPGTFTMQMDGAPTNKNIIVFVFIAVHVLHQNFIRGRARCEIEYHAHDLYDQYQSITSTQVKRSTYWTYEELVHICADAHAAIDDVRVKNPICGRRCNVLSLWEARDFWEWLCPGYNDKAKREHAFASAAFPHIGGFHNKRDFLLELQEDSTDDNKKVGLWAKEFMTTEKYDFLGAILTNKSYESVVGSRRPPKQAREIHSCKTVRETKVAGKLKTLKTGRDAEMWKDRLDDAIAMCERNWDHFASSASAPDATLFRLPHELAAARQARIVPADCAAQAARQVDEEATAMAYLHTDADLEPVIRKGHTASRAFGFTVGPGVIVKSKKKPQLSMEDFKQRRVTAGSFVISRPAPSSHWARSEHRLKKLPFWLWKVWSVKENTPLPVSHASASTDVVRVVPAVQHVYNCQLYRPLGSTVNGKWRAMWAKTQYLTTKQEQMSGRGLASLDKRSGRKVITRYLANPANQSRKGSRCNNTPFWQICGLRTSLAAVFSSPAGIRPRRSFTTTSRTRRCLFHV